MEIKFLGLLPIAIFIIWAMGYEDDYFKYGRLAGFYWDNFLTKLGWIIIICLTVGGAIWAFS